MWLDDEDKPNELNNKAPDLSVGAGGGSAGSSGGTTGSSTGGTTAGATGPQAPQQFATIQDYFGANKTQGEDLGNQFTGKLDTDLASNKTAIDTAANQTSNDINAGVVNYNADLSNEALTDPTKVTGDPTKLQDFMKQYNALYSGPSSFETSANYTPAATAASNSSDTAAELASEGGRQQILQDKFNDTGAGNKSLDQALIQNSSAYPTVQNQKAQFGSVQDYLTAKAAPVNTAATAAQATTDATKSAAQGAFANNLTNFQGSINAKVAADQAAAQATTDAYNTALKSGDATKINDALKNSNLTDAQRANLTDYLTAINKDYGSTPDLSQFSTSNPATDITAANAASAQDYANADAYKTLTGVDYSGVLDPKNAAQASQLPNTNNSIDAAAIDQNLRQYLIQKEQESFAPQGSVPTGSSTQPNSPNNKAKVGAVAAIANPLAFATTVGGTLGITKGTNAVGNALGFGKGKGDAQVTLPQLSLPSMPVPTTANAATTKAITDIYNKPLTDSGSYHEGAVIDMLGRLDTLQSALSNGQITQAEFNTYAQPLAQWTRSSLEAIGGASSQAMNSIRPAVNKLMSQQNLVALTK